MNPKIGPGHGTHRGRTVAIKRFENFRVLPAIGEASIVPDVDRGVQRAEDDLFANATQAL
jgi:hypothetical protein